jgi:hypothetical protein
MPNFESGVFNRTPPPFRLDRNDLGDDLISEKRQIVQLTLQLGASVAEVARAHGGNANQVFKYDS